MPAPSPLLSLPGLPFAFIALFLSEPSNSSSALLLTAMGALLDIAAGDHPAADAARLGPWPRVHAFNVLLKTFNDADLAMDTSAFFAKVCGMWCCNIPILQQVGGERVAAASLTRRPATGAAAAAAPRQQSLRCF